MTMTLKHIFNVSIIDMTILDSFFMVMSYFFIISILFHFTKVSGYNFSFVDILGRFFCGFHIILVDIGIILLLLLLLLFYAVSAKTVVCLSKDGYICHFLFFLRLYIYKE